MSKKHFSKLKNRINESIIASELRVIGPDGKQIGTMSRSDALSKARELSLDLIEIAPQAKPPVAKIASFGKFRYQEEKKKKADKKSKAGELKEIRFSPFIADNDYNTRVERIREFLKERNKVRVAVVFRNVQLRSKNFGYDLLRKILLDLGDLGQVDMEPKFLGRHLIMVVSPTNIKKGSKDAKTENQETNNQEIKNN